MVFSAHAEVVPVARSHGESAQSILRARGGSSGDWNLKGRLVEYSPRVRR